MSFDVALPTREPNELRTRIAPTPSGFFHRGNLVHCALVSAWAESAGASIVLRVDDADQARVRADYLNDIFDALEFLDISYSYGPQDASDIPEWSQEGRRGQYWDAVQRLMEHGDAFVCACSRPQLGLHNECIRGCRSEGYRHSPGDTSIRASIALVGNVVIWRRDDIPAYHLASVMDDSAWMMTHIIRGEDLLESTAIQAHLSDLLLASGALPGPSFSDLYVAHHPLVVDAQGKLSKSAGSAGSSPQRTMAERSWIVNQASQYCADLTFERARDVAARALV